MNIAFDFYNLACIFSFLGEGISESSEMYVKSESENFFSDNS